MADENLFLPFEDDQIDEMFPDDAEPLDAADELALSDRSIEEDPEADLTVAFEEPPTPIGRGWGFDFGEPLRPNAVEPGFIMVGHGPAETHRTTTLRTWIEKCLRTAAGAHPVHPVGYGMERALRDWLSEPASRPSRGQLEEAVRRALLFHSAITEVIDFQMTVAESEGAAYATFTFTVVTNQGDSFNVETVVPSSGEVLR